MVTRTRFRFVLVVFCLLATGVLSGSASAGSPDAICRAKQAHWLKTNSTSPSIVDQLRLIWDSSVVTNLPMALANIKSWESPRRKALLAYVASVCSGRNTASTNGLCALAPLNQRLQVLEDRISAGLVSSVPQVDPTDKFLLLSGGFTAQLDPVSAQDITEYLLGRRNRINILTNAKNDPVFRSSDLCEEQRYLFLPLAIAATEGGSPLDTTLRYLQTVAADQQPPLLNLQTSILYSIIRDSMVAAQPQLATLVDQGNTTHTESSQLHALGNATAILQAYKNADLHADGPAILAQTISEAMMANESGMQRELSQAGRSIVSLVLIQEVWEVLLSTKNSFVYINAAERAALAANNPSVQAIADQIDSELQSHLTTVNEYYENNQPFKAEDIQL